jgi:hypothetical protein
VTVVDHDHDVERSDPFDDEDDLLQLLLNQHVLLDHLGRFQSGIELGEPKSMCRSLSNACSEISRSNRQTLGRGT